MTAYNKGDIYLANVIFTDGTAVKKRPVAIVSGKSFNSKRDEVISDSRLPTIPTARARWRLCFGAEV